MNDKRLKELSDESRDRRLADAVEELLEKGYSLEEITAMWKKKLVERLMND